ncbi:unnamed protein product [Paramecium primaurelia]|uniref:C2H2-type domain-containing protein n=1 Tax=Paramecium primaurelia TaxID=5886 RepID=A0A8S1P1I0_PARPR|nr:unnamed protein product [Paramecium primaurelia]
MIILIVIFNTAIFQHRKQLFIFHEIHTLTQHYQTVAFIYEKCADIQKQIDALSLQLKLNVQIENEETQQQSKINQQEKENNLQEQILEQNENLTNEKQVIIKNQKKKQQNKITSKQFGKKTAKNQQKQKVYKTCHHCDKLFETLKLYQRHQYQLLQRKKINYRKFIKQQKNTVQTEEDEKYGNQRSQKPKNRIANIDSIEICI